MIRSAATLRQRWRSWVALGAAYTLVVQALLTGLSIGVSAAPMPLDASGLVICSSDVAKIIPNSSGQRPGRSHLPNCCVPGCSTFGPNAAPPAIVSLPGLWMYGRPVAAALHRDRVDPRPERTPLNPRAPPLT
jgi:hypothetical protein